MATEAIALAARGQQLRAAVSEHKAAIRRHREQLGAAKAALDAFESELRRRGIAVIHATTTGEGDIHGHPPSGS